MGILPLANRASDFTFLLSIARAPFLKFPCFVVLRLLAPPVAERLHWLASVPPASSDEYRAEGGRMMEFFFMRGDGAVGQGPMGAVERR